MLYEFIRNDISRVFISILILLLGSVTTVHAALSAKTAKTIVGTAPYLTFDGGVTKATNTDELLGITLSDGTMYTKTSNASSASNPIELPVAGETLGDIKTLIPATLTSVNLSTLIAAPHNNWGDDDGDGQGSGGISATGTLSVTLKDVNNHTVNLTDNLSGCNSPYTLTLTSTAGNLKTQYGTPNTTPFTASNTTYYIKPKIAAPYVCFAQPNLNYGTLPYYSDPSYTAWSPTKGFKLQDVSNPGSNFPTMGFNGAYFNLTVAGALGSDVIYSKSPSTSGLDLTIIGSGNIAKVELVGPKNGATAAQAATAVTTTFTLYSDVGKTNAIYSFRISKWFIAKPGAGGGYAAGQTYCSGLGYRVPGVTQYSNGNGNGWTGGLPGWIYNSYQRRIGGGLFAEWGYTADIYYSNSDFGYSGYWAIEPYGSFQRGVQSPNGLVGSATPADLNSRVACVSP